MGRILVLHGDALTRAVVADALSALTRAPALAPSAAEGLRLVDAGGIDAVIASPALLIAEGGAVARRCAERVPPVPVLVLGAHAPEGLAASVAGTLLPPLDADKLATALDAALAARGRGGAEWSGAAFLSRVTGTSDRFPPARVLFLAHRVGATGELRVEQAGRSVRIGMRAGKVVQVAGVPGLLGTLDRSLVDRGDLSGDIAAAVAAGHAADQALQAAAEGLGAWLVDQASRNANVAFDAAWSPPAGAFPLPEPVPRLLARGLARARGDAELAHTWTALNDASVAVRLPADSGEPTWGLDAVATRLLRLAGRAPTVGRVLALAEPPREGASPAGGPQRSERLRALELLRLLGLIVVSGEPMEKPADRRAEPTQEDSRAARLASALAELEAAHPVDALELGGRRRLTEEEVSNAYRAISQRYHPDLYFGTPPALRTLAEKCFAHVNTAYDALRAPGGLAEAHRLLEARARGETYVSEREHLSARVTFRRAEQLFRAKDYAAAASLFEEAARIDRGTWPHALQAIWCGWLARRVPGPAAVEKLDALRPPDAQRAAQVLVRTGTILKQEGRTADALARFRAALGRDPENRDAQREIRLHDARGPKPTR